MSSRARPWRTWQPFLRGATTRGWSRRDAATDSRRTASLPAEVHEHPAEVVRVLLHPVVQRLDLLLLQEAEHPLLELPGAVARDDLHRSEERRVGKECRAGGG